MEEIKKYTCKCESCSREFDEEEYQITQDKSKCILHCEKNDWFEIDDNGNKNWDNKKINSFWNKIRERLESKSECFEPNSIKMTEASYDNVIFPKFQEDKDDSVTNFYFLSYKGELNKIISELNITFKNCKFLDNIELSRYNFKKNLDFEECEFFGDFYLNNTNVKGRITFSKSFFHKKLNISLSRFSNFFINHSFIYEIKTTNTIFEELSVFSNNIFYLDVYFEMNTFEKIAYFRNSIFLRKLNLRDTIFKEDKSFLGVCFKLDDDKLNQMDLSEKNKKYVKSLEIEKEYFLGDRETARIIKDSFEQQNNIIEANKFYALEMKEREKELEKDLKKGKNFFEWLIFKVHGISSNHSQDWILALFWILNITFSLFITEKSIEIFSFNLIAFIPLISMVILGITVAIFDNHIIRTIFLFILSFMNFGIFKIISEKHSLDCVSDKINPFSIMTELSKLDFSTMIYKITIAYLIYQLIVSIRQNTRRK